MRENGPPEFGVNNDQVLSSISLKLQLTCIMPNEFVKKEGDLPMPSLSEVSEEDEDEEVSEVVDCELLSGAGPVSGSREVSKPPVSPSLIEEPATIPDCMLREDQGRAAEPQGRQKTEENEAD